MGYNLRRIVMHKYNIQLTLDGCWVWSWVNLRVLFMIAYFLFHFPFAKCAMCSGAQFRKLCVVGFLVWLKVLIYDEKGQPSISYWEWAWLTGDNANQLFTQCVQTACSNTPSTTYSWGTSHRTIWGTLSFYLQKTHKHCPNPNGPSSILRGYRAGPVLHSQERNHLLLLYIRLN